MEACATTKSQPSGAHEARRDLYFGARECPEHHQRPHLVIPSCDIHSVRRQRHANRHHRNCSCIRYIMLQLDNDAHTNAITQLCCILAAARGKRHHQNFPASTTAPTAKRHSRKLFATYFVVVARQQRRHKRHHPALAANRSTERYATASHPLENVVPAATRSERHHQDPNRDEQ